jgi:predicted metalloprotease with PDZ domain
MAVYAQDYGNRAMVLSHKRMRIPANSPDFATSVERVAGEWIQDLAQASSLVKEKTQKGLPGCMPRFGFEAETVLIENVPYKRVTSVPKKSPAAKAGLKEGDIILAIDSIPYMEFSTDFAKSLKVYEANVSVPIKYLRKTQEMRSNIKAQIMCD